MPDKRRARPYIWVTWLTKLLAGEDHCWWKSWYRVHFKYERTPDDPERADFFAEWTRRHDEIVAERARALRDSGKTIRLEDEAAFKLRGKDADLAGKPDIVALADDETALVIDAKSGKRRESDHWQVRIYLFALPLSWLPATKLLGSVAYKDGDEPVVYRAPHEREIVTALRRLAAKEEPARKPSSYECLRCDIAACPDRKAAVGSGDATRYF